MPQLQPSTRKSESGIEEIAIDLLQARSWPAAEGVADSFRIVYLQARISDMPNWAFRIFDNPGLTVAQVWAFLPFLIQVNLPGAGLGVRWAFRASIAGIGSLR